MIEQKFEIIIKGQNEKSEDEKLTASDLFTTIAEQYTDKLEGLYVKEIK